MPVASKLAIFRNERVRIQQRCSSPLQQGIHQTRLDATLKGHGYNPDFITQSRRKVKPRRHNADIQKTFFLRIPYLNDGLDYALRKADKDIGVRVLISHPQTTLANLLRSKSN